MSIGALLMVGIGGIIIGGIAAYYLLKSEAPPDDSEKIQALIDKVDIIIDDIKKTV